MAIYCPFLCIITSGRISHRHGLRDRQEQLKYSSLSSSPLLQTQSSSVLTTMTAQLPSTLIKIGAGPQQKEFPLLCCQGNGPLIDTCSGCKEAMHGPFFGTVEKFGCMCRIGHLDMALDMLLRIQLYDFFPAENAYRAFLKACRKFNALRQAKSMHLYFVWHGLESTSSLVEDLVSTLVKCGDVDDAVRVFFMLPYRTVFSWTVVISAYTDCGLARKALQLYDSMQEDGVQPNQYTFVSVLKACGSLPDINRGKELHADAQIKGFLSNVYVGSTLVSMYGKCGDIVEAETVFSSLCKRTIVSWTAMISSYVESHQGQKALQLFSQVTRECDGRDEQTLVMALEACCLLAGEEEPVKVEASLEICRAIHADARQEKLDSNSFFLSTLMVTYGKCGSITEAENVFQGLSQRDVRTWNAMLSAYVQVGQGKKALQLYKKMLEDGVSQDERTFMFGILACCKLAECEDSVLLEGRLTKMVPLEIGHGLHSDVRCKSFVENVYICNTLVKMYGKCGGMIEAEQLFNEMSQHTTVSFIAMLTVYVEHSECGKALQLFRQMLEDGSNLTSHTFLIAVKACSMWAEKEEGVVIDGRSIKLRALMVGRALHVEAWRHGFESDIHIGSSLTSMYGKSGRIEEAENVFCRFSERSVVLWTAMVSAYVEQGEGVKALQLYKHMHLEGIKQDKLSLVVALEACCALARRKEESFGVSLQTAKVVSLKVGHAIHSDAQSMGVDSDIVIASMFVCMYGKCGSIIEAENVLNGLPTPNIISWTGLFSAYIEHGLEEKALKLYTALQNKGIVLDTIALMCILQASCKVGNVEMCRQVHSTLVSIGYEPSPLLLSTLIHAYGHCGSLMDSEAVFGLLQSNSRVSWNALISGYGRKGDSVACFDTFYKMKLAGIKPDSVTFLSLLSTCSHSGLVEKGIDFFESMMKEYGLPPDIEHYASVVDLLGRAGDFGRVMEVLSWMPLQPDLTSWLGLLGACKNHNKVELGKHVFECLAHVEPIHGAPYVLLADTYAMAQG